MGGQHGGSEVDGGAVAQMDGGIVQRCECGAAGVGWDQRHRVHIGPAQVVDVENLKVGLRRHQTVSKLARTPAGINPIDT
jgi:hypothetical protein